MHRLFVALRPPGDIRDQLLRLTAGVESARWQDDDQLHLTLRFIGDVPRMQAEEVAAELARVRQEPFTLRLRGAGHFMRKGTPSALWVGVVPCPALEVLQGRVERACRRAGLPSERRKFLPHVTLARLNRSAGPIGGWLAAHGDFSSDSWMVNELVLFESHLTPHGAHYEAAVSYTLEP